MIVAAFLVLGPFLSSGFPCCRIDGELICPCDGAKINSSIPTFLAIRQVPVQSCSAF